AVERGVGPVALVTGQPRALLADLLAGLAVMHAACYLDRRHFRVERFLLLRTSSALLTHERVLILELTTNPIPLGNDLRCLTHHHVQTRVGPFDDAVRTTIALHQAD